MALRSLLTTAERGQVLEIPTGTEDLAAHYTLSEADMSLIRQRRADANGSAEALIDSGFFTPRVRRCLH